MSFPKFLYESRFKDATPTASSTAAGFDVLNLLDFLPYTEWQPGAMPGWVRVDCGVSKAADYAVVWRHNLGSQGATFNVRRSPLGTWAGGDDVLVAGITPDDDKPFLLEFASVSSQHWGIEVTGPSAPSLGIVAIGEALVMPQNLEAGFDPVGRKIMGTLNRTVNGNPRGREVKYELWSQTLDFTAIDRAWLRDNWKPAWEAHLRANPFVFSWDPAGHADELHLVSVKEGYEGPHRGGTRADLRVELEGLPA